MASSTIGLAELLRPWRAAGIYHFLDDPEFIVPHEVTDGNSLTQVSAHSSDTSEPDHGEPLIAPTETAREDALPENYVQISVNPATWPASWREFLPPRQNSILLWTYEELALDLSGQASKVRSGCLKEIIQHLDMPAGTSVFWPVAVREDKSSQSLTPNPTIYQAGIAHLSPRAVVILGKRAVALSGMISGEDIPPYSQNIVKGRMVICLPAFEQLLHSSQDLNKTKAFLRSVVSSLRAQAVR